MSKKINSVEALIDAVRKYPILYAKIGTYSGSVNNEEKNQAWISIGKSLGEQSTNVKAKWRNLRDSYLKAVRNKRELEEINQLQRYHPYRHEEKMNFLYPHILQEMEISQRKRKKKSTKTFDSEFKKEKNPYIFSFDSQSVEYLIETDEYENERTTVTVEDEGADESLQQEILIEENEHKNHSMVQLESDSNECYEEEEEESIHYESQQRQHQSPSPSHHHHPVKCKEDDIEAWLSSVRDTMIKLTKLNRARAKRDINNILSKYEIDDIEKYEA